MLIAFNAAGFSEMHYVKTAKGKLLIFSNNFGNTDNLNVSSSDLYKIVAPLREKYSYVIVADEKDLKDIYNRLFCNYSVLLLPETFEADFETSIQSLKKIYQAFSLSSNSPCLKFFWLISRQSRNFFAWLLKEYVKAQIPLYTLFAIMEWNNKFGSFANKLSKNTITAYHGCEISTLLNEMVQIMISKRANDSLMEFNTAQKKAFKEVLENGEYQHLLNDFQKLSETKRTNFIRKMSSINEVDQLIKELKLLCETHFEWSKQSFLDYISNTEAINLKIVYEQENLIIVRVYDYETIKRIALTTSWCLSKNRSYWRNYIEENRNAAKQYVMFDFSKPEDDDLSIVGFTCHENYGITHAHSFTNHSLMKDEEDGYYDFNLIPFMAESHGKTIFSVLKDKHVPLDMFTNNGNNFTSAITWDSPSVLSFFDEFVGKDNYRLLFAQDSRIIIKVASFDPIQCLFKKYDDVRDVLLYNNLLLFFDFNKTINDNDNFYMAAIQHNDSKCKESCDYVFDSMLNIVRRKTFDHILLDYGAPYTIIKRRECVMDKLEDALLRYDAELVNIYLSDENFKSKLKKSTSDLGYVFTESLFNHHSLSLFDAIYNNGCTITQLFSNKSTLLSTYIKIFDVLYRQCKKYRFMDVADLTNVLTLNRSDEKIVKVSLDLLKKMLTLENNESVVLDTFQLCQSYGFNSAFVEAMCKIVSEVTNKELSFESSSSRPRFTT